MSKKQNPLIPEITKGKSELTEKDIITLQKTFEDVETQSNLYVEESSNSDSFFKNVIKELMNKDNIETKTEYLNVTENFVGTKLSFIAEFGNVPFMNGFMKTFEIKRVSLERKGRKELIMAILEKKKEEESEKANILKNALGL